MTTTYTSEQQLAELAEIIRSNSKTFDFASKLLPPDQRRAIWVLYAFCRMTDELADGSHKPNIRDLESWQLQLNSPDPSESVIKCFKRVMSEYRIPYDYPNDLIEGCKRDLYQHRYETFADLSDYCYQVASTVGLMSMHIIGFDGSAESEAKDRAIKAGLALQLTNILRDVGEDLRRGRIYIPLEDFLNHNCPVDSPEIWLHSPEFKSLLKYNIQRARSLYREGALGLKFLHLRGRFAVGAALDTYAEILRVIEANDYDVLNRRAYVTKFRKLTLLPGVFTKLLLAN